MHIFLVYSPQDYLSLFLLSLAPLPIHALHLLGTDLDTFKATKTIKRVQKYYPQQLDLLVNKLRFIREEDFSSHLGDTNILINNNYQENNYLK